MTKQSHVTALAQKLVRVPSITPRDAKNLPHIQTCLDILEAEAKAHHAATWRLPAAGNHPTRPELNYAVDNLYVEWGPPDAPRSLCFMGHVDVVSPGQGDWSTDPFSGHIANGLLYGRGTTDMKGAVAAFFSAMAQTSLHTHRVGAIITGDEEYAALAGTKHVMHWLQQQGINYPAFIVGEPSARTDIGTHIKVGRRGSLCGFLYVAGQQGHAAYPDDYINAARGLALASTILGDLRWHDGTPQMSPTQWQPYHLAAGEKGVTNIMPGTAEIGWNIRFTPSQTPEELRDQLQAQLNAPPAWAQNHVDAGQLKNVQLVANIDSAAPPYLSKPGWLAGVAQQAIKKTLGIEAVMDATGGRTDACFVPQFFPEAEVIELGPPEKGGDGHGGMHAINECIRVQDLVTLTALYARIAKEKCIEA